MFVHFCDVHKEMHAYLLMFSMKTQFTYKIILIYLLSREGGPPPTQRTNLRFAQIVEDLKNFNFGRPMYTTFYITDKMDLSYRTPFIHQRISGPFRTLPPSPLFLADCTVSLPSGVRAKIKLE